jgi:tetratricopeptide (TPR) repeat protein
MLQFMNKVGQLAGVALLTAGMLCACSSEQSRKANYLAHGRAYFASAHYDKARVEFSNAAQIDPRDTEARFMLGQIAEKGGDVRVALGQYQAAVAIDPNAVMARAAMARVMLYGGLPKKALELVEPGLARSPDDAQLLTVRGAARAQLGDTASALSDAQRAIQRAPDDLYAIALLASVYKSQSEFAKGIAVVTSGLKHHPDNADLRAMLAELYLANQQPAEAEAELRRIVELQPQVLAHRYRLASFYLQQKNVDMAERILLQAVVSDPGSVDAKLQLVQFLGGQRGVAAAVVEVDRLLVAEPANDPLGLELGQFLAQNGQGAAAERVFRAVIVHAGDGAPGLSARDRLASLLIDRKDASEAAALIAEVLKQNVRDNDALILRSHISMLRGQTQAAIDDLRAVLRDQPNAVPVMRTLAQAYQQNGEIDLAEQTLRAAVEISPSDLQARLDLARTLTGAAKLEEADSLLEQVVKAAPDNMPARELLFRLQMAQRNYDQAAATALEIQRATPQLGLGYYLAGLIEELRQMPVKAAQDYEQALKRQPDAGEPLAALARLDLNRGKVAEAMARVDAVIARSPGDAVAHKLKGELLMTVGRTDAAIDTYADAARIAPAWDEPYQGLALAQTAARKYDDALRTLKVGIDRTQGSTLLVGDLGRLYERLGRSGDAIGLYEDLLKRSPTSSLAANNLAMLLVTYRSDPASLDRARALAQQLAASSEVSVMDTRGWVKFKSGDPRGAESLLRQAVDKEPGEPELRYHLGMAQWRSGEPQLAQQNLETALSSGQPFIGRDEAQAVLTRLKSSPHSG